MNETINETTENEKANNINYSNETHFTSACSEKTWSERTVIDDFYNHYMSQGIQECPKYNLRNTAFKKFKIIWSA